MYLVSWLLWCETVCTVRMWVTGHEKLLFHFVSSGVELPDRTHSLLTDDRLLQRFDRWAPLAGDDLHELEAAVVELNVRGVVVLCVDLTGPQRTAVLGLDVDMKDRTKVRQKKSRAKTRLSKTKTTMKYLVNALGLLLGVRLVHQLKEVRDKV